MSNISTARLSAAAPLRYHELAEGESIAGVVVKLPRRDEYQGNRLWIDRGDETISIAATSRRGHTVLERELIRQRVRVGHRIRVRYLGMVQTYNGGRSYRDYELGVIA